MKKVVISGLSVLAALGVRAETVYAPQDASREVRFANPPACARILPLHHGRPNDLAKADAELLALKNEGFGGFAGNVNFTPNYLHDAECWKTFRYTVEKAHAMGMTCWLYDEKGYPSCLAGGQTIQGHPEWQARAYLISITNDANGKVRITDVKDGFLHEGTHAACCLTRDKKLYPNLLMREPTDRFIEITHEAYRRELGPALKYFDSTFTDEPSLMSLWMRPMPYLCLPISDELLSAYAQRFGHPLKDDLPALVSGEPVGKVAEIRHRYWTMVGERVAKNYTGRLTEWATANGILSGGHLLCEEGLVQHVPLYGDFFRVLRGLSAPGCDMLTSIPGEVSPITPLLVGSAGELNGAPRVMSEASDHCQKWRREGDKRPIVQVTVREIVGSLNRQIWGGVNTFTSYYRWQPFAPAVRRAINEEIGRTITLVSEGRSAAEIALLYPADALMTGYEPKKIGGGGILAHRVAESFNRTVRALFGAGRAFLTVDATTLAAAKVEGGELVSGPLRWKTVILPMATTLPIATARRLAEFQKAGGRVIALVERPVNSERAFPDAEIARLAAPWTLVSGGQTSFLSSIVESCHAPALAVARGSRGALRVAHRRTAQNGDVFFVANDTSESWAGSLRLRGDPEVRVWNPRIGLSHTVRGEVPLELPPYAAVVLTTARPVTGVARAAGQVPSFVRSPTLVPPSVARIGCGTYVKANTSSLADGFTRVESVLTKGGVDTFAFLHHDYARAPFSPDAVALAFTVRVPKANLGTARIGVFLETEDGARYFLSSGEPLAKEGVQEIVCAFPDFSRYGRTGPANAKALRPENIRKVEIGYGGYYGNEGERIDFEVSRPAACGLR